MLCRLSIVVIVLSASFVRASQADSQDSFAQATAAFEAKNYIDTAALALKAEQQHPGSTPVLLLRAKALIHLNEFEQAQHALEECLKANDKSPDASYLLGYVLFRRDLPGKSLEAYTAAAQLQRPTADDFKIVGLDYVLLNDYPDAIHWLERAAAEAPNEPETLYDLGRAYYVQNNFGKAVALFTRVLALDPRSLKAQNNLGLAFEGENELEKAASCYREAIEIGKQTGKESDQPYINLAQWFARKNRWEEALPLVDLAEQIGGKSERAEEIRGKILFGENRLREAEEAFRQALALSTNKGPLHYQLGRVLQREGKEQEAAEEFAQTKSLLGNKAPAVQ